MQPLTPSPIELGYCTNVHPYADLEALRTVLQTTAVPLRQRINSANLVVGLHLNERLVRELREPGVVRSFAQFLASRHLRVVSLNVFPQSEFHQAVVKRSVYEPDWSTAARAEYTLHAAELLLALAPSDATNLSLSTLPLGHASLRSRQPDSAAQCAARLLQVVRGFAVLEQRHGRTLQLAIEPEPACLLETCADLAQFYAEVLLPAAASQGINAETVQRHVGACFDCCHGAVMQEAPADALGQLAAVGCRVMKVQISAALAAELPAGHAALLRCAEPRYLHQTSVRGATLLRHFEDLPMLPPDCKGEARTHFHIPIHAEPALPLRSTAGALPDTLRILTLSGCRHYEVETYTFHVLPQAMTTPEPLVESLARELLTARKWLGAAAVSP